MSKNVTPTQGVLSLSAVHAAQWAARSKLFTTSKGVCGSAAHAMTPTSLGMTKEGVQGEWVPRMAPKNQEELKEMVVEQEKEEVTIMEKEKKVNEIVIKDEEQRSLMESKSLSLTTDPEPLYAEVIKRK